MNSADSASVVSANNTKQVGVMSSAKLDSRKYFIEKSRIVIKYAKNLISLFIQILFIFVIAVVIIYAKRNNIATLPNRFT